MRTLSTASMIEEIFEEEGERKPREREDSIIDEVQGKESNPVVEKGEDDDSKPGKRKDSECNEVEEIIQLKKMNGSIPDEQNRHEVGECNELEGSQTNPRVEDDDGSSLQETHEYREYNKVEVIQNKKLRRSSNEVERIHSKKTRSSLEEIQLPSNPSKLRPLGLTLTMSQDFVDLVETTLNQGTKTPPRNIEPHPPPLHNLEPRPPDIEQPKANQLAAEKMKASNFSITHIQIGTWKMVSRRADELIAKCYYAKRKLVWEVLERGLKSKLEIQWTDISAIRATFTKNQPGILEIQLSNAPLFFQETDPQPRKHTLWHVTTDFTGGQATISRRHYLQFAEGTLEKHYERLLQCDERLFILSKKQFPALSSPYFNSNLLQYQDVPYAFSAYQLETPPKLQFPYIGVQKAMPFAPNLPVPSMQASEFNNAAEHHNYSLSSPYVYQNKGFTYDFNGYQSESPYAQEFPFFGVQDTSTPPKYETTSRPPIAVQAPTSPSPCYFNPNAHQNQNFYAFSGYQLQPHPLTQIPFFDTQGPTINTNISTSPMSVMELPRTPVNKFNNNIELRKALWRQRVQIGTCPPARKGTQVQASDNQVGKSLSTNGTWISSKICKSPLQNSSKGGLNFIKMDNCVKDLHSSCSMDQTTMDGNSQHSELVNSSDDPRSLSTASLFHLETMEEFLGRGESIGDR